MRWPAFFGVAMLAAMAHPAAAQEQSACTTANAISTTIAEITAAGDASVGRCVSIEGLAVGRQLHADNQARYRQPLRHNDPSSTGAILGLYGIGRSADRNLRVRVTGRISNCAVLQAAAVAAAAPNSIVMMSGFCHNYAGLVIEANTVTTLGEANLVRIARGAAPPELGNLEPLASGAVRDRLLATATSLFAGLDTPATFRTLLRPEYGRARTDTEIQALRDRLAATGAASRDSSGTIEIFGWRTPSWMTADERQNVTAATAETAEAIACRATVADAAARWPISDGDAMLGGSRPYICVRVTIDAAGTPTFDAFDNHNDDYGIAEP